MNRTDPNGPDDTTLSISDRIDMTCDAFEQELLQGRNPRIEKHLSAVDGGSSAELFVELLKIEIEYRRRSGEEPRAEEYTARFPDHAGLLANFDFTLVPGAQLADPPRDADGVSRFELLEKLGAGGFGTVWRARDTKLDRTVALKLPHPSERLAREAAAFLREAKAAARLRHPNIIAVHDFAHAGESLYIVFEYVAGVNLGEWLKRESPGSEAAAELCAKIARALDHAHAQGIVHRDLKPANVIMDEAGEPHVTDFGLAKRTAAGAAAPPEGSLVGTPAYMSPEQARGDESKIEPRTDIYALGVMLYELLTGSRPFQGTPEAVIQQILSQDPEPPRARRKSTPRDLETICLKAMAKQADDRYASAGDMALDLERFLHGEAIQARRSLSFERWRRWARQNRRLVVAEALVVCVILGSVVTLPRRAEQANPPNAGAANLATTASDPPAAAPDPAAVAAAPADEKNRTAQAENNAPPEPPAELPADTPAIQSPLDPSQAAGPLGPGPLSAGDILIAVPDHGPFSHLDGFPWPAGIHGPGRLHHSSAFDAIGGRSATFEAESPWGVPHFGRPHSGIRRSAPGATDADR